MSNILIISALFPPEPVVSALLSKDIAEELSRKHNVVVICPKPSRPEGYNFDTKFQPGNYTVIRLNSYTSPASKLFGRFKESYSFGIYAAEYIRKNYQDIKCIYINSWPLLSQYKILDTAKKYSIPCILHVQDIYPESIGGKVPKIIRKSITKLLLPVDRFVLRHTTVILGISDNMISYLSETRHVSIKKFRLVQNWQNDDSFLKHAGVIIKDNCFVFMYVGSISASAGVDILIMAYQEACLANSKLIIAGNGAEKVKCIALAAKLGNTQIEFCEVIPEKVPELQSVSDVLLLPLKKGISKTATPSKLTAYLFSGKPVVACVEEESDVANIIAEAYCGFIVEPENIRALSIAMTKVYKMERSQLEIMGKKGQEYAFAHLSKKVNLQKVISTIENVIST